LSVKCVRGEAAQRAGMLSSISMSERAIPYWEEDASSPGIFINYRYVDIWAATHLDSLLVAHYGSPNVFRADRSLCADEPYGNTLQAAAGRAAIMLVLIGQDWRDSLAAGRHNWVFTEMHEADDNGVALLPVILHRVHNEHDERKLWTPVERPHEAIITQHDLPPGVPRSLLLDRQVAFGTKDPESDVRRMVGVIDAVIAELSGGSALA